MSTTTTLASILVAARTEKGHREENQDAMTAFTSPFGSVYLIADGMGGQQGGAAASLMVAECYRKYLTSLSASLPVPEALQRATSATNSEVRLRSQSGDPAVAGMGSTVVMVVLAETAQGLKGTIAHVGDSRGYLVRDGQLRRLTRDHSAVQRLIDSHEISSDEARHHPNSSVITRALGQSSDLLIEVSEELFCSGDTILLCSDGLSGYVADQAILTELAQHREVGQATDALVELALDGGSSDNITVQVLRLGPAHPASSHATSFDRAIPPAVRYAAVARSFLSRRSALAQPLLYLIAGLLTGAITTASLGVRLQSTHPYLSRSKPAAACPAAPVPQPVQETLPVKPKTAQPQAKPSDSTPTSDPRNPKPAHGSTTTNGAMPPIAPPPAPATQR